MGGISARTPRPQKTGFTSIENVLVFDLILGKFVEPKGKSDNHEILVCQSDKQAFFLPALPGGASKCGSREYAQGHMNGKNRFWGYQNVPRGRSLFLRSRDRIMISVQGSYQQHKMLMVDLKGMDVG